MADEYIRREDAIRLAEQGQVQGFPWQFQMLVRLPSAEGVPVVYGEWEDKEVIHKRCIEEWQSARCSVCGKYHTTPYMYYFDDFKFCPNCGAKMDDEGKE